MLRSDVPVEVLQVEDRLLGNLTLRQVLLLLPAGVLALICLFLPPSGLLVPYKMCLLISSGSCCLLLALRLNGQLVADWLRLLISYNARPQYYVNRPLLATEGSLET